MKLVRDPAESGSIPHDVTSRFVQNVIQEDRVSIGHCFPKNSSASCCLNRIEMDWKKLASDREDESDALARTSVVDREELSSMPGCPSVRRSGLMADE